MIQNIDLLESLPSPWEAKDVKSTTPSIASPAACQNGSRMIEFTVYHEPMGAPRMTQRDRWKGRPVVERYHQFRDAIRRDAPPLPPPDKIASFSWIAYFSPPKKQQSLMGELHRVKPDRDNIDKAILDALFDEDAAIASGSLEKRWGKEAKLVVTILLV